MGPDLRDIDLPAILTCSSSVIPGETTRYVKPIVEGNGIRPSERYTQVFLERMTRFELATLTLAT